ncbi:MAG TPA: HesA/MoeB/ThiF family protein [Candidatus Bathyarchaeia archaeon]|nr:HesA/MoeB/ThiF family protein [Candidatus Bathyarchaeia archaeon]
MTKPTEFQASDFYSRQIALHELGREGQERLRHSKATIVGLGGLGSVSCLFLAMAGVGRLTLVDQDTVELNNLHRQALYSLADIRYPKVEAASRRLAVVNPEVKFETVPENLNEDNIRTVIGDSDCVVDGLDNMNTRYLISRYCVEKEIPYVFGGAIGFEGNVAVFKTPETPCLECVLPGLEDSELPTCNTRGVIGATTGIVGSVQAMETIKLLSGITKKLESKMLVFDFIQSEFRIINLAIRPDCSCQNKTQRKPLQHRKLAWLCGSDTVNVNPQTTQNLNLEEIGTTINAHGKVLLKTPLVIVFDYKGHEISLFRKGRMLIKNVKNEQEGEDIFKSVDKMIGVN